MRSQNCHVYVRTCVSARRPCRSIYFFFCCWSRPRGHAPGHNVISFKQFRRYLALCVSLLLPLFSSLSLFLLYSLYSSLFFTLFLSSSLYLSLFRSFFLSFIHSFSCFLCSPVSVFLPVLSLCLSHFLYVSLPVPQSPSFSFSCFLSCLVFFTLYFSVSLSLSLYFSLSLYLSLYFSPFLSFSHIRFLSYTVSHYLSLYICSAFHHIIHASFLLTLTCILYLVLSNSACFLIIRTPPLTLHSVYLCHLISASSTLLLPLCHSLPCHGSRTKESGTWTRI